jgi:hypothetical protein
LLVFVVFAGYLGLVVAIGAKSGGVEHRLLVYHGDLAELRVLYLQVYREDVLLLLF